jgi:hypothetical protein
MPWWEWRLGSAVALMSMSRVDNGAEGSGRIGVGPLTATADIRAGEPSTSSRIHRTQRVGAAHMSGHMCGDHSLCAVGGLDVRRGSGSLGVGRFSV